jgi:hypothetical protein
MSYPLDSLTHPMDFLDGLWSQNQSSWYHPGRKGTDSQIPYRLGRLHGILALP